VEEHWVKGFPSGFRGVSPGAQGKAGAAARACPDARCVAAQLKGSAELAARGEVSRLGGTYYVRVELIDIGSGAVEGSAEKSCGAQEEELVRTIQEATREVLRAPAPALVSDRPAAEVRPQGPASAPAGATEMTYVKVENKNKKKALYACLGGAVAASAGVLWIAASGYQENTLPVMLTGTGLAAFVIGGAVYVVSPDHHNKPIAVPVTDGKSAGIAISGRF
jgi:hypothetical protein